MIVKVLENVVSLVTIVGGSCCLSVKADPERSDTAVLLASFVAPVTLSADKVRVGAFRLQVMLES